MEQIRIERIKEMEQNFDVIKKAVSDLELAIENFKAVQNNATALSDYYYSKEWMADFDADNNGEIPADLKRGVLSEDGIYNALSDNEYFLGLIKNL